MTSVPDRGATVCLSATQTSALNTSTENEEVLLTDDVFESTPSQRLLNLTDSVRRLAGGFQSTSMQPEDEWVSTSSESGTPVLLRYLIYASIALLHFTVFTLNI